MTPRSQGPGRVRSRLAVAAAASVGYVAATRWFADPPGRAELAAFRISNAGGEHVLLRVPQQLGTPWALVGAAALHLLGRRPRRALVVALVLPVEKALEVGTKRLTERPRPVHVTPTELRDDAPVDGPSYPSGHAAIATAATYLCAPLLPRWAGTAGAGLSALGAWVRVHQGAHHPGDVVGGILLGTMLGAAADAVSTALEGGPTVAARLRRRT